MKNCYFIWLKNTEIYQNNISSNVIHRYAKKAEKSHMCNNLFLFCCHSGFQKFLIFVCKPINYEKIKWYTLHFKGYFTYFNLIIELLYKKDYLEIGSLFKILSGHVQLHFTIVLFFHTTLFHFEYIVSFKMHSFVKNGYRVSGVTFNLFWDFLL